MMTIDSFLTEFNVSKIPFVHWKSNTNIEKALNGEDDLDILVRQSDKVATLSFFKKNKIFRAISYKDFWQKEIFHYYTISNKDKKLIHIHIHFGLVLGYDYDKCINLPVVEEYMYEPIHYKNIRIPSIEKEYVVLIIRIILKNSFTSFLLSPKQWKYTANSIEGSIYNEFIDLHKRHDDKEVERLLENEFSIIDYHFFKILENEILENNSRFELMVLSIKLRLSLKKYSDSNFLFSFFKSFYRLNLLRFKKLFKISVKKKVKNGKIFAFVGGDGAGKSTNIDLLGNIFEKQFRTHKIHIGRPRITLLSRILIVISKLFKLFRMRELRNDYINVAIAISRLSEYNRGVNLKNRGAIVLFDRIPLKDVERMDSPRVKNNGLGVFYRIEQIIYRKIYDKILDVDLLFVLKLNPLIAIKRRPLDNKIELIHRSTQIWEKGFKEYPNAVVIDTELNDRESVSSLIVESVLNEIT